MWVKLKIRKRIEVAGQQQTFEAGDWVKVGKQIALQWIANGEAEGARIDYSKALKRVEHYEPHIPAFTLFAVPMSFQQDKRIKQDNAIGSWLELEPRPIVFLFGKEPGIAEAAQRLGCLHLPRVAVNEFKTPLVGDAFMQAQRLMAPEDVLCYVNSDIILLQDFANALKLTAGKFEQFLMVGQRWDADIHRPLEFRPGWQNRLRVDIANGGRLHGVGAIDYFAFRPGLYKEVPPFAIGRSAWDNWLVGHAVRGGVPVIDATQVATAIHQDKGAENVMTPARSKEKIRNRELYDRDRAGVTGSIKNATWYISSESEILQK